MRETSSKKPRRKLLQIAALSAGTAVGAAFPTGCASSIGADVQESEQQGIGVDTVEAGRPDVRDDFAIGLDTGNPFDVVTEDAADANDSFVVGLPPQDVQSDSPPGITVTDAGITTVDAGD